MDGQTRAGLLPPETRKKLAVPDMKSLFPILDWAPAYSKNTALNDLVAALIVTIMLVP
jgi:hypothetical protein